jgi:hypothetical protein
LFRAIEREQEEIILLDQTTQLVRWVVSMTRFSRVVNGR